MSKMMNVTVNSYLSNEIPTQKAIARIKVANKLIEILEDRVSRSLKEIEAIILENMGEDYLNSTSVKSILEWFEQAHLITTEIREEEFITIQKNKYVYRDSDNNIIPEKITIMHNGQAYQIYNPALNSPEYRMRGQWEETDVQVQVKRRYYTWVA